MKKFLIATVLTLVVLGVVLSAGCVSESVSSTTTTPSETHLQVDSKLFEKTGDADKDYIIGTWVSTDDLQGQITNMSGQRTYTQVFNDGTFKEHWFTYVDGEEYLSTTEGTWEVIKNSPSKIVSVTKPASFADDTIKTEIDESVYTYRFTYKWAGEEFNYYYTPDSTQTNVLRNHDNKQFRKMDDNESVPALK